jgi:putative transposase
MGYASKMPARDAELVDELTRIATTHSSYGHRFAWAILHPRMKVNRKRVRRVWRLLGLHVRRKKRRKVHTGQTRTFAASGPNQVWAYDFVHDTCANGQAIKALTVVDEWTRECLAIEVATSLTAERVIAVLERLFGQYGTPQVLRSDNGPEFIARALKIWALLNHSDTATIEPGKPWQNGSIESFNGTFRRECLNAEYFAHLREAKILIEQWRWQYNTQRPHSSLGYRRPAEVGDEARAAMKSKPSTEAIADPVASLEVAIERRGLEVHPITTESLS